jgi:hypothetical protein
MEKFAFEALHICLVFLIEEDGNFADLLRVDADLRLHDGVVEGVVDVTETVLDLHLRLQQTQLALFLVTLAVHQVNRLAY